VIGLAARGELVKSTPWIRGETVRLAIEAAQSNPEPVT